MSKTKKIKSFKSWHEEGQSKKSKMRDRQRKKDKNQNFKHMANGDYDEDDL